jgi:hypothetical protein
VIDHLLVMDPDIIDLERRSKALYTKIKWEHRFIKRALEKKQKELNNLYK